jgi:hypothetical protein
MATRKDTLSDSPRGCGQERIDLGDAQRTVPLQLTLRTATVIRGGGKRHVLRCGQNPIDLQGAQRTAPVQLLRTAAAVLKECKVIPRTECGQNRSDFGRALAIHNSADRGYTDGDP